MAEQRILVVQLADLGDLVLSTPALAALRAAHPAAHIALLTTAHSAPLVAEGGLVDEVITFDKHTFDSPEALLKPANLGRALALARRLRAGRYDVTVYFHHFSTRFGALKFAALGWSAGSARRLGLDNGNGFFLTERVLDGGFGARHQAQYWLDLVGRLGADPSPRPAQIAVSDADRAWARAQISEGAPAPVIAIHAGSGGYSMARRWEPERFAAVADALAAQTGARIVLVGAAGDDSAAVKAAMRADTLDLSGQTTLGQLAALFERCELLIGADSGVMHIAAASGTRVLAVFGPSNPDAWGPWTGDPTSIRTRVVRSAPECSPCSYVGHAIGLREGCRARTCMRLVTAQAVTDAALALLSDQPPPNPPLAPDWPAWRERIRILGVPVSVIGYDDWIALIGRWIETGVTPARHVCTVNPEYVMIAQQDSNFSNILQRADLTVPDGVGLLWAARRLGTPLPERVTGSDGVPRIAEAAAQHGWKLYFLGAAPRVAEQAAEILRARYPGLQVVETYSGSPAPEDEDALVARVNASGADLLFVAYGAPEQDKWIARNLPRLNVRMAMGVGGTFDFIAGVVPRAPESMRQIGLEWLYRLYLQPWRIGRMLRLPRFVLAVLRRGSE